MQPYLWKMIGKTLPPSSSLSALAFIVVAAGCAAATGSTSAPPEPAPAPAAGERPQSYTAADVHFMSGMIGHHAQAIHIAQWAPTHDASPSLRILAARVINAQRDEIALMQQWLRDRGQPVPEVTEAGTMTGGAAHSGHMAGMLSDEQLAQLDQARGKEFDRLFLRFMIQHHNGAVTMVKELFGSYGAALDDTVFKLASDISADQSSEIDRMQQMLAELTFGVQNP
ncbi:MAG: DUF305 domain-containing protein [Gemmatimonadaceae bacterium]